LKPLVVNEKSRDNAVTVFENDGHTFIDKS
jgi:hypothetical protein